MAQSGKSLEQPPKHGKSEEESAPRQMNQAAEPAFGPANTQNEANSDNTICQALTDRDNAPLGVVGLVDYDEHNHFYQGHRLSKRDACQIRDVPEVSSKLERKLCAIPTYPPPPVDPFRDIDSTLPLPEDMDPMEAMAVYFLRMEQAMDLGLRINGICCRTRALQRSNPQYLPKKMAELFSSTLKNMLLAQDAAERAVAQARQGGRKQ